MDVIVQLRDARHRLGISQEALGKRLGMSQAQLPDIEKGKVTPRLASVVEIARALDQELILVPRNPAYGRPYSRSDINEVEFHEKRHPDGSRHGWHS